MLSAINPRLAQDLWNGKLNALSEILIYLRYSFYYCECTLMRRSIFEYKLEDIEITIEWKHFHQTITYSVHDVR